MSADTDPHWALILGIGITVTILGIVYLLASNGLVAARAWIDRRNDEHDETSAADFGEASRAQIEACWEDCCWPFEDAAFVDGRVAA